MIDKVPLKDENRSFKGRLWTLPEVAQEDIVSLINEDVPPFLAPVLASRGIKGEDSGNFLKPTLRELLPNPAFFKGMKEAVARVSEAVKNNESVTIWGDYDVDGATSSAVLKRFFRMLGLEADIYIPDRITEGYGPNEEGLKSLKDSGVNLVCILDSGTVAFEPLKFAKQIGLDVVVIDHHAAEADLPEAIAVVNPNRLDQEEGYGHVCAAGMTFIFCVGLNAALRNTPFYNNLPTKPDLMSLLDLVGLGTVADVVPLTGINRAFVRRGLEVLSRRSNPGIAALCNVAGVKDELSSYHCGFVLGPRINAGGRIGAADTGARLLSSDDPDECLKLARELDEFNRERQKIEKECTEEAKLNIDNEDGILIVKGEGWHEGVVGIVASRLKEMYDRPTFCFSIIEDNWIKGSGRSIKGFDMGRAVIEARKAGIFDRGDIPGKGGGHGMAAGITMAEENLDIFKDFMNDAISKSDFGKIGIIDKVDVLFPLEKLSVPLVDQLVHLEPFGQGNPKPRFMFSSIEIHDIQLMKEVHLRIDFKDAYGRIVKGLLFNAVGSILGDSLLSSKGSFVDILGTIDINEWRGDRSIQIMIEDARPAEKKEVKKENKFENDPRFGDNVVF